MSDDQKLPEKIHDSELEGLFELGKAGIEAFREHSANTVEIANRESEFN